MELQNSSGVALCSQFYCFDADNMKKKLSGSKQKLLATEIQWHIEAMFISSTILLLSNLSPLYQLPTSFLKMGFQTIPIANLLLEVYLRKLIFL